MTGMQYGPGRLLVDGIVTGMIPGLSWWVDDAPKDGKGYEASDYTERVLYGIEVNKKEKKILIEQSEQAVQRFHELYNQAKAGVVVRQGTNMLRVILLDEAFYGKETVFLTKPWKWNGSFCGYSAGTGTRSGTRTAWR